MADDDASNLDSASPGDPSAGSPIQQAIDAIIIGPGNPAYGDPMVRPWIDLMTSGGLPDALSGSQVLALNSAAGPLNGQSMDSQSAAAQQKAVSFAKAHLGDGLFSHYGELGWNDEVGGNIGHFVRGMGFPKCNFLVHDAYESAGAAPTLPDGSIPRTVDWFNPNKKIVSGDGRTFEVVHQAADGPLDQTQLQPGDIFTNGHHMGIYAPGSGAPTISAATLNGNNILPGDQDHPWLGGVTRNNWGFRNKEGDDNRMVVRRLAPR